MYQEDRIPLDPSLRCPDAVEFEEELRKRVVGQEEAVIKITEVVQRFMADYNDATRPVGNLLLLGPTGTGKTRVVEAVCEVMFGSADMMIRIDCGEFKHGHETAKILGAPPGYTGHKESGTQITQEKLDKTHTPEVKLSVLLLDEIEKAHENFWEMLLGILDKGRMTDALGRVIDFTHTIIFMTSNLGAREVIDAMQGGMGFVSGADASDGRIEKISSDAASKRFTPEFMNRLDHVITFKHLSKEALARILDIESGKIQKRVLDSKQESKYVFTCLPEFKAHVLAEGTSKKYGARYLKRTLEKYIVNSLVGFVLTAQIETGDLVEIGYKDSKITYARVPAKIIARSHNDEWKDFKRAVDEDISQDNGDNHQA